jgi:hypothetical protein
MVDQRSKEVGEDGVKVRVSEYMDVLEKDEVDQLTDIIRTDLRRRYLGRIDPLAHVEETSQDLPADDASVNGGCDVVFRVVRGLVA